MKRRRSKELILERSIRPRITYPTAVVSHCFEGETLMLEVIYEDDDKTTWIPIQSLIIDGKLCTALSTYIYNNSAFDALMS